LVNQIVKTVIQGRVQGVGYRDWAERQATSLGLKGYVRNRRDGTVELLLSGPEEKVEQMLALCREGPRLAQVTEMNVAPATWEGEGFDVLPTL